MTRLRWPAIGVALVGAVLLQVSSGRTWFRAGAQDWTGSDLTSGLVGSLAWLVVISLVLLLVVRVTGRRVVGVLIALVGLGGLVVALTRVRPGAAELARVAATTGTVTGAHWVAVIGGVLTMAGGVVTALAASSWPVRQRRGPEASGERVDLWKAQDAGLDPTSEDTPD